jgi:four helix bundle suffix protein
MNAPEAQAVRAVPSNFKKNQTDPSHLTNLTDLSDAERGQLYAPWLDHQDPAVRANALICLINQANFLLDRQIAALEAAFIEEGGYSEQLATARLQKRKQDQTNRTDQTDQQKIKPPPCPVCGSLMSLRTAKTGKNAGQSFWGCTLYPNCKGTVKI